MSITLDGTSGATLPTPLTSTNGGTGNGFTKFTGPTTLEKTFTLPDASAVILTDNADVTVAQGGTGIGTTTAYGVLCGGTTATGAFQNAGAGTSGQVLVSGGASALPSWKAGPASGPAFSAYGSAYQAATTGVFTKIAFNTEEFDTNNNYDSATNYRFTPTIAGYYCIGADVDLGAAAASGTTFCRLYKNGSSFKNGNSIPNSSAAPNALVFAICYANGSTDYFEIYARQNSGGTVNIGSADAQTTFFACFLRGA